MSNPMPYPVLPRQAYRRFLAGTFAALALGAMTPVHAHHGVAGLGAAGLEGPGAPLETAASITLPAGNRLLYLKADHAQYRRFSQEADGEADYAQFWIAGLGYGFTPWLSAYVFVPYHIKVDEPGGFDTRGWADMSVTAQLGFKYDQGFQLTPAGESLDDFEDWHFSVFGGATLPTGDSNTHDAAGNIDPGKSNGFGRPAYSLGVSANRVFANAWTFNIEASYLRFEAFTYADNNRAQFGDERRLNTALVYRALTLPARRLRLDTVLELQYLGLARDRTNGTADTATGGDIFYALPGVRLYSGKTSFGIGIKRPIASNLNEDEQQQGAEGKERYRLIVTGSVLF